MTTTTVGLAYGRGRLSVELPAETLSVVQPRYTPALSDPAGALRACLGSPLAGPPLAELVRPGQQVAIAICDVTRPQPRRQMLEAILEHLDGVVPDEAISVLVATGSHRASTGAELEAMLGGELIRRLRVLDHDATDPARLRWAGTFGENVPVWLAREWMDADVRVTTGFVEPHFFAGFSGGPKLVAPGLAGLETILCLHDARRIGDPRAAWGVTVGNPVHDDIRAIAAGTGVDFGFDVVLNRDQQIVAGFAGELFAEHAAAVASCRELSMAGVGTEADVVVTSAAGYPLDQNLYQSVKAMSAAAQIVAPGGTIIVAAECSDGFPDHGSYRDLLRSAPDPASLLAAIESRDEVVADQWQVQVQARVQRLAEVVVHTGGLSVDELAEAHLGACADISAAVVDALAAKGPGARVAVLPEGPTTIPYLLHPRQPSTSSGA
jgi:nickel-dependent lactate racemase